jgi:hypothetical protein
MKLIAKALVIATLATAAAAASAAQIEDWPSGGRDNYNQTLIFPNIATYESQHRASERTQATVPGPSSAEEEIPLSAVFPGMQTYQDIHRNDPVNRSSVASTFPSSADEVPSMADEGLVPGIVGVAPYVNPSESYGVGATR